MKSFTVAKKLAISIILAITAFENAIAQTDQMNRFIEEMLQMHKGKTLCVDKTTSIDTIRTNLISFLQVAGIQNSVTPKALAMAMWATLPCPFSPIRQELRPATEKEIEGVWLFPEKSQKLRFPPQFSRQSPAGPVPVKCDAVGYYPKGELRHAVIAGQAAECPFSNASDLDIARKNPQVSTWTLLAAGRIGVTRTDVPNHVEEWDIFIVATPFVFDDIQFSTGDLVAYIRKENGNNFGIATQFRHLKKLK